MQGTLAIAEEIATLLSSYNAVVECAPDVEIRTLKGTRTIVMPVGRAKDLATRGACDGTITIDVGVIKKVAFKDGNAPEIPSLMTQMENIGNTLLGHRLTNSVVTKISWNPLYDFDQLRTKSVFVGVMELTIKDLSA